MAGNHKQRSELLFAAHNEFDVKWHGGNPAGLVTQTGKEKHPRSRFRKDRRELENYFGKFCIDCWTKFYEGTGGGGEGAKFLTAVGK